MIYPYFINGKKLETTRVEKDLSIWIAGDLTWTRHVLGQCAKENQLLGIVKRSCTFGYDSQVWSPQSINLVQHMKRVQRRTSKFMLSLPFLCREFYRERLITLELTPLCYWHEYLDLVLFRKAVTGQVDLSSVLSQKIINQRTTRSSSNGVKFRSPRCKTFIASTFVFPSCS